MNHDLLSLLITQTWQITLLIALVWIVTRYLTNTRPHLAHALWLLVLIKCLTPPVVSSPTSVFSWLGLEKSTAITSIAEYTPVSNQPTAEPAYESPLDTIVVQALPQTEFQEGEAATSPFPIPRVQPAHPVDEQSAIDWSVVISRIWILGAALGLAWTSIRFVMFLHWIRKSETCQNPDIRASVQQLRKQLGIRRRVRVRILRNPVGPAVLGLFRPTILLPASIVRGKSSEDLRPLLAHELIHIRRGDLGWAMLQTIARNLFWFHPLVRLAARMVTRESERSCDEETVASLGCEPAAYANGLLEVLEHKHRLRVAPALPGVRPVDITSARLERVMNLGNGIHRRTPVWVWLVLMVGCVIVLPGAALVVAQERLPVLPNPQPAQTLPGPPLTTSAGENWRLQIHKIPDLIEKYEASNRPIGYSMNQPLDLADILGCRHPRADGTAATPNGRQMQVATDHGVITSGNQHPTMKMVGQQLYVFGTDKIQQEVSAAIDKFRHFGFRQIIVESRMLRTEVDQLEKLGIDWSIAPAGNVMLDSIDPRQQALDHEQAGPLAISDVLAQDIANRGSADIANFASEQNIAATSYVERNSPVLYATVDSQQMTEIVNTTKSTVKTTVLQAPTVTMYNGQNASVVTGAQRPFVVGMKQVTDKTGKHKAFQPVIRVINEGIVLNINAEIVENDQVILDFRLEQSQILNVETVKVPLKEAGTAQPAIQIPEVATTRVQSSLNVPVNQTLVITSIQRNAKGESELFVAFLTCRILDKPTDRRHSSQPRNSEMAAADVAPANIDRLAPGDVLGVSIEGVLGGSQGAETIGSPVPVRQDGTISLPLIHKLKVQGLTAPEVAKLIADAYTSGDEPIMESSPDVCLGIVSRANGDTPSAESLSAAPANLVTGKQLVGQHNGNPLYAPELTPAATVERDVLIKEIQQARFVIRAEGSANGKNPEPLVKAMQDIFYGATIEGNVDFEIVDSLPTVRGNKLHISIDDSMKVTGDRGEMQFLTDDEIVFRFQGDVRFAWNYVVIVADELTFQKSVGIDLKGSASIETDFGTDKKHIYSADRIVVGFDSKILLEGNARFLREDGQPMDIQAEYIEIDMETEEVKSFTRIPGTWTTDELLEFGMQLRR